MPRGIPGSGKKFTKFGNKTKNTTMKQIQTLVDRLVKAELKARIKKVLQ